MDSKDKKKYPVRKHLRNVLLQLFGTALSVLGYSVFIAPNDLLPGGVWGFSAILHHFLGFIPMPVFLVLLNLPLLIWGWNKLNLRFALYTVWAILLQSGLLALIPLNMPVYTNNPLLACFFGGLLSGIGSGIVVRYHGSGGGTEIVGIILKDKYDISVGSISLFVNIAVVFCASLIFGFEPGMYTIVNLVVGSTVFTRVLEGMNSKRNMMIISQKGPDIARRLIRELGRGVTMMKGEGCYTHQPKDVLFCVVSRFEMASVKEIIIDVDPEAFVCINQTYEVMGAFPRKAASLDAALKNGAAPKPPQDPSQEPPQEPPRELLQTPPQEPSSC